MTLFVPELDINTIVIENVERQVNHIDVLLTVHDDRNRYKIIVEDKTFTSVILTILSSPQNSDFLLPLIPAVDFRNLKSRHLIF